MRNQQDSLDIAIILLILFGYPSNRSAFGSVLVGSSGGSSQWIVNSSRRDVVDFLTFVAAAERFDQCII
jgi:hypothetical protein